MLEIIKNMGGAIIILFLGIIIYVMVASLADLVSKDFSKSDKEKDKDDAK